MGDIYHKKNTYAGSVPIDDTQATATNTWSGQKINNEIDTKASKSIITSNDVFDPIKAYAAGNWLIHNNILYEVKAACTGVTPPNATYYNPITLHELKNRIDALNSNITAQFGIFTVLTYYYGAGGTVEVPIILPTYNNTMAIISGQKMASFMINASGNITSPTSTDITVTYSNGKLSITGGSWYTGSFILCSWKAR